MSLPVAGSQHGSMFSDRDDASLTWYLPAFAPADPTDAFGFAAVESGHVDSAGNPLDNATVAIPLVAVDPPDVAAARAANPAQRFQAIVATAYTPTLLLPFTDQQGNNQTAAIAGQASAQADGTVLATFAALLGATVVQAYQELSNLGGAQVQLQWTYNVLDHVLIPIRRPLPFPIVAVRPQPIVASAAVEPRLSPVSVIPLEPVQPLPEPRPMPIPRPIPDPAPDPIPPIQPIDPVWRPIPVPPEGIWTIQSATATASVALANVYSGARYKPRYTITSRADATRPIIDASDLTSFVVIRSEYRELTSLGDVSARYASINRLYLGQFSGTVVAVPSNYAIVRSGSGLRARLDAVVDTSPSSISGCRFQFTFELAPAIDPVDFAQLAHDLMSIPEASTLTLTLSSPTGADQRVTPTFSAPVTNLVYAAGPVPGHLLMSFEVTDTGSTPALVNVNLLLAQLTSTTTTPLFGTIGVALDDLYTPAAQSSVVIALTVTSPGDEFVVDIAGQPPTITATNRSPNDLTLLRMRTDDAQSSATSPLGQQLPAGQSLQLPTTATDAVTSAAVSRTLTVPSPFPRAALSQYLELHAETVQQAMHSLTVNATAIDFAAEQIVELDITITIDALPTLSIPPITLRPEHRIDGASVVVPIAAAITTLQATITVTVRGASADRQAQAANDFASNPIFVLTPGMIAAPPQSAPPP